MTKQDFEILMNSLYSNNQLFIPYGQNIKEWINNAFVENQDEAINYTPCCPGEAEQLFCDCETPKPTDPYDVVDKHICRDCKQIIAK